MFLCAGLHRQILYGGLRIGLYEPVKNMFMGGETDKPAPLPIKIAAGMTTGAFAIAVASPTDLVKVGLGPLQCVLLGRVPAHIVCTAATSMSTSPFEITVSSHPTPAREEAAGPLQNILQPRLTVPV